MLRGLLEAGVFFALPFVIYSIVSYGLIATLGPRYPRLALLWSQGRLAQLTIVGLVLAILSIVGGVALAPRHLGAYVPAHLEDGRLIPGRMD